MKKNIFLILVDGLRYDFIEENSNSENIIPNIKKLIEKGISKKLISNGDFYSSSSSFSINTNIST